MQQDISDEKYIKAIYDNWLCRDCCWFDGKAKCLKSKEHNGDEDSCYGVLGCADFVKIDLN